MMRKELLANYLHDDHGEDHGEKELVAQMLVNIYPSTSTYDGEPPYHDTLIPFAGKYKWKERDCTSLLHAFVETGTKVHTPYKVWHQFSTEAKAFVKAKRIFGSALNAHNTILQACGMYRIENIKPWSVVLPAGNILKNLVTSGEHKCDDHETLSVLIVDDGYNFLGYDAVYGWTPVHVIGNIDYIYNANVRV